jgi:hypothetical protein
VQEFVWRGMACRCQFYLTPAHGDLAPTYSITVRLLTVSVPIGKLAFQLYGRSPKPERSSKAPDESHHHFRDTLLSEQERSSQLQSSIAHRNRHAFLSYSSHDRPKVLECAQLLRLVGISYFQDLLSLAPGERWERRLYQEIERCELFLLFWSSHAANSQWVLREAEYAVDCQKKNANEEIPEIAPVILEVPPPSPPKSLSQIHFNDPIPYFIAALDGGPKLWDSSSVWGSVKKPI